jgi:catechol 2,3-dioxygenase-like lactoylglutathione lyase family enzyme
MPEVIFSNDLLLRHQGAHIVTSPTPPSIECEQSHAGLVVSDLAASIEFYVTKLGFSLGFTWGEPAIFAGVSLGEARIFLKEGAPTPNDGVGAVFFPVGDADALYEFHRANGVEVVEGIADREYAIRDYVVKELNGHRLVFGHYIYTAGPKIRIERVDVPVRLEKRLAGLLKDLAEHKKMSVDSCLEEILLHTNEGVEPHTKSTLRYIEELRKKHGIDYDSHGSYRFVEE